MRVDSVRNEFNYKIPHWCGRITWWGYEKNPPHPPTLESLGAECLDVMGNEIFFLISFTDFSLLVCRNVSDLGC